MATTPVSLAQFGQNIKAKHPEYGDMADEDVASRVLKKYPQYQDMVLPAGATGPLPGMPSAPTPAGLQGPPSPQSAAPRLGTFGDTVSNVGTHLKNMVAGPYHAFTDAPQGPTEQRIASAPSIIPGAAAGLGLYRMLAKPTIEGVSTAVGQAKAGNFGLKNESEYDAYGNYRPTMLSGIADAIPIAGPWARGIENDAQQKGMVPALAGMGTDMLAPKVAGKAAGAALRVAGKSLQLASTTAPAAKLAATRLLVPGTPGELLQSALKPGVKYGAGAGDTLEASLPDVLNADPALSGVSGFARAADKAKDAAYQPYSDLLAPYRPPVGGIGPVRPGNIDGAPIANRVNASIPAINRFESSPLQPPRDLTASDWTARNPVRPPEPSGIIARTAERASLYRTDIPVSTADALREDANAKLNAFYNKAGGDQNAALSSPETAAVKAIGDGVRAQLYPKLEADNGLQPGAVAAMQNKFGTLSNVADIANKREPVFARHDPISLAQKVTLGGSNPFGTAYNYLLQRGVRRLTDSDAQVNSAVDRFSNPSSTPLAPRSGLFPQMGSAVGGGLYGTGTVARQIPLVQNPLFYSAAANPPRKQR